MAKLSSAERNNLPDSAFAFIEPGHEAEKVNGKTPGKYRHYPIHDANHVRAALSRIGQGARFAAQAKAKVLAAAKKHGIEHDMAPAPARAMDLWPEMRFVSDIVEVRGDGNSRIIGGYAASYNRLSRKLGSFVEKLIPGVFDESRSQGFPGVAARYNHDDAMLLGTTAAGTCRIELDERGMRYEVDCPLTRQDTYELVQRGDVRYSSFAFRCRPDGDTWTTTDFGAPLREVRSVEVVDVAPVHDPAYFDTTATARGMQGALESLARYVGGDVDEVRRMVEAGEAVRFFKRSDRPSVPSLDKESAEARMNDDDELPPTEAELDEQERQAEEAAAAAAAPEPSGDETTPAADERSAWSDEETRARRAALIAHENLCRMWTHGEPCVMPKGHGDDHAGPCWGRVDGLPCNGPMGHGGKHTPMPIANTPVHEDEDDRSAASEGTETRATAATGCGCCDNCTAPAAPEALAEGERSAPEAPAEERNDRARVASELAAMRLRLLSFDPDA